MAPHIAQRQTIAKDTIARSKSITNSTPGASLSSIFIKEQLPPLDPASSPQYPSSRIRVINSDSFTAAREIIRRNPKAWGKTVVLNLASDEIRAGGWIDTLWTTQEEALCYSSTLYETLKEEYYPWPNLGPGSVAGVYSPAIVVFRDDLDHDLAELPIEERVVVSVVTVAAPRLPNLSPDKKGFAKASDLEDLRGKIRLVYRMAAHNGQQYLVLAAMGCGAYRCPPELVVEHMKSILLEGEFKGWFREVTFAIYSTKSNGRENFEIFYKALAGVEL